MKFIITTLMFLSLNILFSQNFNDNAVQVLEQISVNSTDHYAKVKKITSKLARLGAISGIAEYEPYHEFYVFKKDVYFLGAKVLWFQASAVRQYVGCCPESPVQQLIMLANKDENVEVYGMFQSYCESVGCIVEETSFTPKKYANIDLSNTVTISFPQE